MTRGGAHFSSGELARVLSHYDIGIIKQVKPLALGSTRAAKVTVISEQGKFLLKRRARGKDDPDRVAFAHSIQSELLKAGFPAPALLTASSGRTMLNIDKHIYELFEYVNGCRYDGSAEATTDAGRQLARFHLLLTDFKTDYRPLHGSFHDSPRVREHLDSLAVQNSADTLHSVAAELAALYDEAGHRTNNNALPSSANQIVHGDWHPGNMLFSASKVIAVLDFDSVKFAPPATDLANAMLQFSIVAGRPNPADWPDYLDQAKLVHILTGYHRIRPVTVLLTDALPDLMVETMIAEAVLPVVATGFFGNLSGTGFLKMILRKCRWIKDNRRTLTEAMRHGLELD